MGESCEERCKDSPETGACLLECKLEGRQDCRRVLQTMIERRPGVLDAHASAFCERWDETVAGLAPAAGSPRVEGLAESSCSKGYRAMRQADHVRGREDALREFCLAMG